MNRETELESKIEEINNSISEHIKKIETLRSHKELLEKEFLELRTGFKCGQLVEVYGQKGVLEFATHMPNWKFRPFIKAGTLSKRTRTIFHSEKIKAID